MDTTLETYPPAMRGLPNPLLEHPEAEVLQRLNLRLCTITQNSRNAKPWSRSKTGLKGIYFSNKTGKWLAQIKHDREVTYLGTYPDPIPAAKAYDSAAKTYFGDFACLNFPGNNRAPGNPKEAT